MARAHFHTSTRKSLVQEKRKELDHDVVVLDESTAYTADENNVTSISAASSTPTPPTSQARKRERPPLSPGRPGPYPVRRVPTPFFDWTAPRTSGAPGIQCLRFGPPQLIRCTQWLGGVCRSECREGSVVETQSKLSVS